MKIGITAWVHSQSSLYTEEHSLAWVVNNHNHSVLVIRFEDLINKEAEKPVQSINA